MLTALEFDEISVRSDCVTGKIERFMLPIAEKLMSANVIVFDFMMLFRFSLCWLNEQNLFRIGCKLCICKQHSIAHGLHRRLRMFTHTTRLSTFLFAPHFKWSYLSNLRSYKGPHPLKRNPIQRAFNWYCSRLKNMFIW